MNRASFFLLLSASLASACSAIVEPNIALLGDAGAVGVDSGARVPCSSPGTIETIACGNCGTLDRFCAGSGFWENGPCVGQGVCAPGTIENTSCGNCGTQASRCNETCSWETTGTCTGEGECAPGSRARSGTGCPDGSNRDVLCSAACVYEAAGMCERDTCPTPGAIEEVSCGLCGTQSRFCAAGNVWEYGPCTGEGGECAPGTIETQPCGMCGEVQSRCSTECRWESTGSCTGEGECSPGSIATSGSGCPDGQQRTLMCSSACLYEVASACMGGGSGGGLGELCVGGTCDSGLVCDNATGISICRNDCTTDTDCASGTYCFTTDMVCSDDCTLWTSSGCPTGAKCDLLAVDDLGQPIVVCSGVGTGGQGSSCTTNSQCQRNHTCVLETETTGRCRAICDSSHMCAIGTCQTVSAFSSLGYCQ